ncbi:hypothetical protein A2872_01215 [Candidatus Gottesmanbacteria bacterium RIFCSPHIGHO2_01_FULL_42_12]|uniref:Uncharacterized protein n=1 Tax=Candidatus Gottesmanbacteria bacterium RIFCSPHIGHO2_01_FULL_42_12 TaxID=1798377 RepID=A0A1F5Z1J4_9BACT|nr:MAG: hypothetical protein A2872_01215 [Candidatus Gottesmanbacteria bacterium RIFCSPHIGHO2_01_FULL_42_12]
MSTESKKIAVMIGPPGVGKNTIGDLINRKIRGFCCLDGDSFISPTGVIRLQTGLWSDDDRREYLSLMATGVTERANNGEKIVIADAMTTKWMREFFENRVREQGNFVLAWILVTRQFEEGEVEKMIAERAAAGHPMNSLAVFHKYFNAFETIEQNHLTLQNPGPRAGEKALLTQTAKILSQVYER